MSEEETTVVSEATDESTEATEINADSSVEDIIASQEEADDSEGVTPSETEQTDAQGESETPPSEDVDTSEKSVDEPKEGDPVAYTRFDEVNKQKNQFKDENTQLRTDLDEAQDALKDPEVLSIVLKKRGYSDEAISNYLADKGMQAVKEPLEAPEFDLNTVEGWDNSIDHKINQALEKRLGPVEQKLSKQETERQQREADAKLNETWTEAEKLAKDRYKLEFGRARQDENNPNTAVGKMYAYLEANPDVKAISNHLGYAKILELAMSNQAVEKGEEKGVQKEKKRQETVKAAAMESETSVTSEDKPSADWPVEKIIEWNQKHGE